MVATTIGGLLLPGLYDSVVGWANNSISLALQSQGVLKFWKKIKIFSRNAISLESGIITCYGNNSKTIGYLKSILKQSFSEEDYCSAEVSPPRDKYESQLDLKKCKKWLFWEVLLT